MTPSCIGIVGGMSPQSTSLYYQTIIARHVRERGDHAYPRIVISSVSFQQYITWQNAGDWKAIAAGLDLEFKAIAAAGATFGLLAVNTMHKVLPDLHSPIPVLSVIDAVAGSASRQGHARVGLTGTRTTMRDGFYTRALQAHGLGVVVPSEEEQDVLHRIIYEELIVGNFRPESRARFAQIAHHLAERGAEAILLGCTELELLVTDLDIPLLRSTAIHAELAWEIAVGQRELP
jgi:aspartate racemase